MAKKQVIFIQRVLPHYRLPFFDKLYGTLFNQNINMKLVYGQEYPGTVPKTFPIEEPWAHKIRNRYFNISNIELVWQPCLRHFKNADIIVVEQANRLFANYFLLSGLTARNAKIAYWGHGKNLQTANASGLKETFKSFLINKADWWFAYTGLSADIVKKRKFPEDRITVINNTIDTSSLSSAIDGVTDNKMRDMQKELGIESENICVFCGSMYSDKRLDFLVESCRLLRQLVPDFHMIFMGDGPLQQFVSDFCANYPWMHYVGPKFGNESAPYLKIAKAMLMPGLVGLVIIDSFVAGIPLFTTDIPLHSPEIYYLENNENGIMTENNAKVYAQAIAYYLKSPEKQDLLKKGCAKSAKLYTIDNMVNNFASGIVSSLSLAN